MNTPKGLTACDQCGAANLPTRESCWLCHARLLVVATAVADRPAGCESRAAYQFSLATIMLVVTLAAVLLGVFRISPGLGALLVIVVAPAFVRTCINTVRRKAQGETVSQADQVAKFASSAALVMLAVLLVPAAIFVALFVVCLAIASFPGAF